MAEGKRVKSLREEFPNALPLSGGSGETFKWDTIGKTLRGRFLRLRDGSMGGQLVLIDTGEKVETASAPITLAEALDGVKPGTEVVIRYTSEQPSKKNPKNSVKYFEVVALV